MNEHIVLKSLDFAIRQYQIGFMINGRDEDSLDKYIKYKSAYKKLRSRCGYDAEICVTALRLFKEHLENSILKDEKFKGLRQSISDEIQSIQYQIDMLN